jgi:hypothetical protein
MSARDNGAEIESAATQEEAASEALVLARGHSTVVDAPITGGEMAVIYRLANGLAQSGFFKDARQAQQAFAKLIFGRDLGLSATQAMTDIHIVEGKPEMSANLQAGKVRSSERYEYRVVELTNERCEIAFTMDGEELVPTSVFTMEDAVTAGLVLKDGDGYKLAPKRSTGWVYYPRNMLFARAMSNGVAFHCPDVMNGIRVYAEGEVTEGTPAPQQAAPAQVAEETVDGEVQAPAPLSDEDRASLTEALAAAGIDDNDLTMLLTAVGVDSTDDLDAQTAYELRQRLGEHLARKGARA